MKDSSFQIEAKSLDFQYETDSGDQALKGIDLKIGGGECIVLTGESGCGKTTLTRCLNGLIPNFYEGKLTGALTLRGKSLPDMPQYEISRSIGTVFQDPRSQFFTVDSTDEVAFGCENLAMSTAQINRNVDRAFENLRIMDLKDRSLFHLSSGERQKLAIASIYAMDTPVMVLDEPSANLDQETMEILRQILLELKKEGRTLIISEHRLSYLMGVADKYLYIKDGRVEQVWMPEEALGLTETERNAFGLRCFRKVELKDIKKEQRDIPEECRTEEHRIEERRIEGKNLSVKVGGKEIFRDMNFCFRWGARGKLVGITGENGSGKTTFARVLCGLLKQSEGKICIDGGERSAKARTRRTYFVMQDVDYQLFTESVRNELRLAKRKNKSDSDIEGILKKLRLFEFADRHPLSLSGGQKQRVTIAAAMVSGSDILVFDEPTSGLDGRNMLRLREVLRGLKAEGKMIFVITHDMEFLDGVYDEIMTF